MNYIIPLFFFVLGTILGSFFNVVGWRLPNDESIVTPPSHCPNCGHRLGTLELIPIISYIIQMGKCKNCQCKISWYYPAFEFLCGLLFLISYIVFGLDFKLIIVLTFISMLIIIMVSDINFMMIPDEVLIFFGCLLALEIGVIDGYKSLLQGLLNGSIAFAVMYLLKTIGDFVFKKESMGGGDIKLMFIFGLVLGCPMAIISIFVGSIIGLPISLFLLLKKSSHIIPFGPFLSVGAIVILLSKSDLQFLINLFNY